MMNNVQLICDSTCGFMQYEIDDLQVRVVPLSITWDDSIYVEETRDTYSEYYKLLKDLKELPSTSQPSFEITRDAFERELDEGKDIIALTLSSGLSGTYSTFTSVAIELDRSRISVIDSLSAVTNNKYMLSMARQMLDNGSSREETVAALEDQTKRTGAIIVVDDLKFLKKGGRLNNASYFLGRFLSIYPLILLKDGKLTPFAKVKGYKNVFPKMMEALPENPKMISVLHADNPQGAESLAQEVYAKYPDLQRDVEELSPVIGTHLGNGAIGIAYCW